jgi:hypothetical protein
VGDGGRALLAADAVSREVQIGAAG